MRRFVKLLNECTESSVIDCASNACCQCQSWEGLQFFNCEKYIKNKSDKNYTNIRSHDYNLYKYI